MSDTTTDEFGLTGESEDRLRGFQADGEPLAETLERILLAFPHSGVFQRGGVDPETVDSDTEFVAERMFDADGYAVPAVSPSLSKYIREREVVAKAIHGQGSQSEAGAEHLGDIEDWDPLDCVLCDNSADTVEEHRQHMEDEHDA